MSQETVEEQSKSFGCSNCKSFPRVGPKSEEWFECSKCGRRVDLSLEGRIEAGEFLK